MNMLARDLIAMPVPAEPAPWAAEAYWQQTLARNALLRAQHKLHVARGWRCSDAIAHWEACVVEAIDRVFNTQENFKAARRHWA